MRKLLAALAASALFLTGCAGNTGAGSNAVDSRVLDESSGPTAPASEAASASPSEESPEAGDDSGTTVEVEIEGESVSPNGKRVEAGVGEPVTFEIESDRPGELHVHSSPEQVLAFDTGSSTVELTIDKPGVVDVELHDLEAVVVQLEVS